ncbi:hypothetical protein GN958_ATG20000 [Phytophthora infestans]|uniref:Uncharacterized protein n=1 Tax=Phytophthora infestans TaxID=4787 RepID=A0A8S9TPI8_PHYIN|nr:hypothetical protein GN958_ATG20000 [Phytophthora infestans]
MDASDSGLCVLFPAAKEYIRVQFDKAERSAIAEASEPQGASFSINVREALSAVFAAITWGPDWSHIAEEQEHPLHIRCWIVNSSAVAWIDRHYSNNSLSQELMRVLTCVETQYKIHVSSQHLPGATYYFADLGSRAWNGDSLMKWTNLMLCWIKQKIPSKFRRIYTGGLANSSGDLWQTHHETYTWGHGANGVPSALEQESHPGATRMIHMTNRFDSLCSQLIAGKQMRTRHLADLKQFGLKSAISDGVINSESDSSPDCSHNTNSCFKECAGSVLHDKNEAQYRKKCSSTSSGLPTSPPPSTASFVGLRCWASSFVSEVQST